jgi:tetratricopeptide (TPR) repeat protein
VLYLDNNIESARQLLGRALARAETQKLTDNNASDFGKAYFLLGYMYDPYVVPPPQADPRRALAGYSRSIELNPDFHAAILNRAKVFETLGELDRAFADYNTLIAAQGPLAAEAAVNRAFLQINDRDAAEQDFALAIQLEPVTGYWSRGVARQDFWDDLPGALADFQAVVKLEPRDYFYYESLGQAQLLSGQAAAARETYGEVITRLNQATRQGVIERLESLAQSEPDLADDVAPIMADLRAASLP